MRIEDIDRPRVRAGAAEGILRDHEWLGLDWDAGPHQQDTPERAARYRAVLTELGRRVYLCSCSRRQLREAAALDPALRGAEGPIYAGTCRVGPVDPEAPLAMRFRLDDESPGFHDAVLGEIPPGRARGDFVLRRRDGLVAYQLAVVVDDHDQGVTEVVRGADLVGSTPRQIALYRALGWEVPGYFHLPLIDGPDGRRLAKSHGSVALADYRAAGWTPEAIFGLLGHSLGLTPDESPVALGELAERFAEIEPVALADTAFTLASEPARPPGSASR